MQEGRGGGLIFHEALPGMKPKLTHTRGTTTSSLNPLNLHRTGRAVNLRRPG